MSIYSLKMRASRHENGTQEHVSGAEKILRASELTAQMDALLQRALHHAKGKADFINLKIEEIQPDDLQYMTPCRCPPMRQPPQTREEKPWQRD